MKPFIRKILAPFERYIAIELIWMILKYQKAKLIKPNLYSLKWLIRKDIELLINRLKIIRTDNSFANESATIAEIVNKLAINRKYLVDIGAADGIRQSPTALFLNELGWEGSLFEYDPDSFARLAFLYNHRQDLSLCKTKITPFNTAEILTALNVPKNFGYLNIDIDSYDLSVLRAMLDSDFRPSIISMEINENFGPEYYFEVKWNENHTWKADHFFGCSLTAANSTLATYNYVLVKMEYNNAIFVTRQESSSFKLPTDMKQAYLEGYLNKKDRLDLFPWNQDLEFMHSELPSSEKIKKIEDLFHEYSGHYILKEFH